MKPFFLLLSSVAFFTGCNNSPKEAVTESPKNTDLIQQHLQGKVQSLTETSNTVDSTGKTGKMDSVISVTDFDEKGYASKFYEKDSAGKVHLEETISRYDNGILKEATTVKDGKQTFKLAADIDKDGHLSGGKTYDSTGKQDSYYKDLQINEYGIVYAGKQYGMNNKIKQTFDLKYDGANNLGGTVTDSTGKPYSQRTVKVNDKGHPVEETTTTGQKDSTKTEKKSYKYDTFDDKGNWTQQTTYNEKGQPTKITKRTYTYYKD